MSTGYTHFILSTGFECIYDDNELLSSYYEITGKNYENVDDTMIKLIRKYKQFEYKILHVKTKLLPYIKVERNLGFETIVFNSDNYKINLIKKVLSSASDLEDSIMLIESIIFQEYENPTLTDSEFLNLS